MESFFSNAITNVQAYLEPNQTSKLEVIAKILNRILWWSFFVEIINWFWPWTSFTKKVPLRMLLVFFAKSSISDVWQGFEYVSVMWPRTDVLNRGKKIYEVNWQKLEYENVRNNLKNYLKQVLKPYFILIIPYNDFLKNHKNNSNNDKNNYFDYSTKIVKSRFNLFPANHSSIFAITVFSLVFWFIYLPIQTILEPTLLCNP